MAVLIWSEKAVQDLENVYEFIAADSPFYAKIQIERIIAATQRLSTPPSSYPSYIQLD